MIQDLPSGGLTGLNLVLKLPLVLNDDMIKQIADGALILYVYGVCDYYNNTLDRPRKSTFYWCGYYDPQKTDKVALVICPEHNYTTVQP